MRVRITRFGVLTVILVLAVTGISYVAVRAYHEELNKRVWVNGTIVTTYTLDGNLLSSGSAWTVVDLDDGRRMTFRGISGVAGDRRRWRVDPRQEVEH